MKNSNKRRNDGRRSIVFNFSYHSVILSIELDIVKVWFIPSDWGYLLLFMEHFMKIKNPSAHSKLRFNRSYSLDQYLDVTFQRQSMINYYLTPIMFQIEAKTLSCQLKKKTGQIVK